MPPSDPRAETITRSAEADYSHSDVPRCQYARVKLRLEPLAGGSGLEVVNEIPEGNIPAQWFASIEQGIHHAAKTGVLNNGPVVYCRVTYYDGAYHDRDSNDETFFIAAQEAFWQAMRNANPALVKTQLRLVSKDGEVTEE